LNFEVRYSLFQARLLSYEFLEGIEGARAAIDKKLHASFNTVHDEFLQKLATSRSCDVKFFESVAATASMLSAPLAEEQIETTFTRDGERVTEIVEIGKRIEMFRKSVEKDEAKLKDYWKQWEDLQGDFIELGIEVFGPEVFGGAALESKEKGFKKEMELLDLEHDARVQELTTEVENIREGILQKMTDSEKVCACDEVLERC
jgi:phosphopantothenoylcysteine decarboxylase